MATKVTRKRWQFDLKLNHSEVQNLKDLPAPNGFDDNFDPVNISNF